MAAAGGSGGGGAPDLRHLHVRLSFPLIRLERGAPSPRDLHVAPERPLGPGGAAVARRAAWGPEIRAPLMMPAASSGLGSYVAAGKAAAGRSRGGSAGSALAKGARLGCPALRRSHVPLCNLSIILPWMCIVAHPPSPQPAHII